MKKYLCLVMIAGLIIGAFSGCAQSSPPSEGEHSMNGGAEEVDNVPENKNESAVEASDSVNVGGEEMTSRTQDGDYRNFYGIVWNGNAVENLQYAKQMGYDYVFYKSGMETLRSADGLRFYIETPEYGAYPIERTFHLDREYTSEQQEVYEKYFAWKSQDAFPNNLATGWFFTEDSFSVQPDFQQQAVIDEIVERILKQVEAIETKAMLYGIDFKFGGFAWDVPNVTGDFYDKLQKSGGRQITLAHWTGEDSSALHEGITHEYETYTDGTIAYYKTLAQRTKEKYPDAKFMVEPYNVYGDWFAKIEGREGIKDFNPVFISSESPNLDYLEDKRILENGLASPEVMGCTTPNVYDEAGNRRLAGELAVHGAWFSWYGRFGGTGNMPPFKSIYELPDRLKLIRMIPNWDNLNKVPLSDRKWDGEVYQSPNSYASSEIIYSRHPKNGELFVVFLDPSGTLQLNPGEKISTIHRVDGSFTEAENGAEDLEISSGAVRLKNGDQIEKGYIVTLSN